MLDLKRIVYSKQLELEYGLGTSNHTHVEANDLAIYIHYTKSISPHANPTF